LGLCPKPRRGSLELLPQTLQLVLRSATSKGKKARGREGEVRGRKGLRGGGGKEEREGNDRGKGEGKWRGE